MAKNKFSIHVLDEYAKKITYAQAKRLYEAKTHLKFEKALFEAKQYNDDAYVFYMDNSVFYDYIGSEPGMQIEDTLNNIYDICGLPGDYSCDMDGITFITNTPVDYEKLLIFFEEEYNIPTEIINDNIDQKYLNS